MARPDWDQERRERRASEHGRERLESIEKQISTQSRGSAPRVQRDAFHTLSSQRVT
jgi:hypothetical protein